MSSSTSDEYRCKFSGIARFSATIVGLLLSIVTLMSCISTKRLQTTSQNKQPVELVTDPISNAVLNSSEPRIAWLLTFPGSGHIYTSKLVQRASKTAVATNYGNAEKKLIEIYENKNGPYFFSGDENYPLPSKYILTNTHCAAHCVRCTPDKYDETPETFLQKCKLASVTKNGKEENKIHYDEELVAKAVHVVRNPLDNIVERFLNEYKDVVYIQKKPENFRYSFNQEGFRSWCKDMDDSYEELERDFISDDYWVYAKDIPCRGEFVRYVKWHNYAFDATKKLNLPTHVVKYEDYADESEATLDKLMNFLELSFVGTILPLSSAVVQGHFTDQERQHIAIFLQKLSSEETWAYLRQYFPLLRGIDRVLTTRL